MFESRALLQAAPVPLLREFAKAVAERPAEPAEADDPLRRQDLGDLELASGDARAQVGGPVAATAKFALGLDAERREFELVVRAREPRASAQLANAFALALIHRRDTIVSQRIAEKETSHGLLRALVRRDRAIRPRLSGLDMQIRRLRQLPSLPGGGLSVVRRATIPRERASPRVLRDVLAAGLLGLLIGMTPVVARSAWPSLRRDGP